MHRIDHCGNLIHFTKGKNEPTNYEEAYQVLKTIVNSSTLKGSNGMILGGNKCVCFTEAPVRCLTNDGKLDAGYFKRYTPFGIQITKRQVFNYGGRPVIYSLREEYEENRKNESINWRYVSYDPNEDGRRDFTWEREWRIKADSIQIEPNSVKLVFPNEEYINRFITEHEKEFHRPDDDCEECFCTRDATIFKFTDFLNEENCEALIGTCPNPDKFPWILIDMNEK